MSKSAIFVFLALASSAIVAATPSWEEEITALPRDYDAITAMEPGDVQAKAMDNLLSRAIALQARFPERGLALAWIGWTQFQMASSATDFTARIRLLKESLANLEAAVASDPYCCGSEVYIALASLAQAPVTGKASAEAVHRYFAKALEISPNSLIAHTHYAGYLMRTGAYEEALRHANAALAAPTLDYARTAQDKALREAAQDLIDQTNDRIKRSQTATATK
jgi:tetratricopeptide (TPR) repeat protein